MLIQRPFWKKVLEEQSEKWRLVSMVGPRQVGKSTFLRDQGAFFSFDDPKLRAVVRENAVAWLRQEFNKNRRMILDEVARLPELFEAMKIVADENPNIKGRIWFASSSHYLMAKNIQESLAGRVVSYTVSPFLLTEISKVLSPTFLQWLDGKKITGIYMDKENLIQQALKKSLFPEPFLSNDIEYSQEWLSQYISTYVLRDLSEGFPKTDFAKWQNLIQLLFSYPSSVISTSRLGKVIGIHHQTVQQYMKMAQTALLFYTLPVYSKSSYLRLTKGNKIIMVDSALCRAFNPNIPEGALFENFVISQILHLLNAVKIKHRAYHWRTSDHAEVDLILEGNFGTIPIEIKSAKNIHKNMLSGLRSFLKNCKDAKRACVFYRGSKIEIIENNIYLLPIEVLFM